MTSAGFPSAAPKSIRASVEATLNIDPQDGDLDLLEDIERVFEIRLEQQHVGHWRTLGDVHRTLLALVPVGTSEGSCPTSMAFYHLRRALRKDAHARGLGSATELSGFVKG